MTVVRRFAIMRTAGSNTRHHHVADSPFDVRGNFLDHAAHAEPRLFHDIARLRLHLARKHLEERALAFAIAADKANPVAGLDVERHVVQQRSVSTDAQEQVLGGKNRHGLAIIPVPERWHRTRAVPRSR